MKIRFLPSLGLIIVLLAACAPAANPSAPAVQPTVAVEPSVTLTEVVATPSLDLTATDTLQLPSVTPTVDVQPIATSRGPNLEATDPTTVSLASGGLQFVEFFRFT